MITKTVLSAGDLAGLLDGVFEYNRRGRVHGVLFYDAEGKPLPVAWVEAVSEEAGLAVRTRPDPTPEEAAAASLYRPLLDPRQVQAPQSMAELAAAGE